MLPVLQLDHAVIPFFARCQSTGLPIDRPGCLALAQEMHARKEELLETLKEKTGYYLNPNSDDQVRTLLKELLPAEELDDLTLTPSDEISTNKKNLEALRGLHAPIDDVIDYRKASKIETSFALPLAREMDPPPPAEPNRARSNLRLTRVASGRVAASVNEDTGGASLLTIPTRDELGRRVRSQFTIQVPGRVFLARDLSGIEFRVCAHFSRDRVMCEIFNRDQDIHKQTASRLFGLPEDRLDKWKHRYPAKTAGFLVLYGGTARGLRDQMRMAGIGKDWPMDRCEEFLEEWFTLFHGVRAYISMATVRAAKRGYAESMSGRRRYLPGAASALSWVRAEAVRQAVSLEIQGTAQDILKQGMAELWPLLQAHWRSEGTYLEPLLQVHDELLFEADQRIADSWSDVCDAAMTTTTQLRVPITSSGGTATDWGSLEK